MSTPEDTPHDLLTSERFTDPRKGVWNPTRQCTATSKLSGNRCRRQPIPGGTVCAIHGGAIPLVQRSAKMRLLEGADLAIDYLLNLLTPKLPCEHCGRSDADRDPTVVRACQLVLDRSGFHPTLTVEHTPPPTSYEGASPDELVEKLEQMLADAKAQRDAQRPAAIEAVIDDSYLVPEDDAPSLSTPAAATAELEGTATPWVSCFMKAAAEKAAAEAKNTP
jgi:hypothetical protein